MSVRSEIANKVSELSRENLTLRNQLEEFEKSQDKRIDEIFCEFLTVLDTFERAEQTIKERELDKDEVRKKAEKERSVPKQFRTKRALFFLPPQLLMSNLPRTFRTYAVQRRPHA